MVRVGAGEESVVVAAAKFDELLRLACGGKQAFGMAEWEHFVIAAVKDQQRRVDPANLTERIVFVPRQKAYRQKRKHFLADIANGREWFLENDATDRHFGGEINGYCRAE